MGEVGEGEVRLTEECVGGLGFDAELADRALNENEVELRTAGCTVIERSQGRRETAIGNSVRAGHALPPALYS